MPGNSLFQFCDERQIVFARAAAVHQFQNTVFRMLQRDIRILDYFVVCSDFFDEFVGERVRIAIQKADRTDIIQQGKPTNQLRKTVFAV